MKRALRTLALGSVAVGAAVPASLAWFFLHPPRRFHRKTPKSALGLEYERLRLQTEDGLSLSAWHVPHPAPRALALVCHGYFGNREMMLPYLEFLHAGGYSALLFDFRNHGWSDGSRTTFGMTETADLRAAIAWARRQPLPIFVLGESMGAAVALLECGDHPEIRALVCDSAFARLDSAVQGRLTLAFGKTLGPLITPPTRHIGSRLLGKDARDIAPIECVEKIGERPLFLIHGEEDGLIPVENAHALFDAAPPPVTLWTVPGARHVKSVHIAPEYPERVLRFLDDALS